MQKKGGADDLIRTIELPITLTDF